MSRTIFDGPILLSEVRPNNDPKTLVILVPGVATAPPGSWFQGHAESLTGEDAGDALPSPAVYRFDHKLGPKHLGSRPGIWTELLNRGLDLLGELLALVNADRFRSCPIVFVAHSLGGIIVKRCLTRAIEVRSSDCRKLTQATAAFVAIATPHSKSDNPKDWNQPQLIIGTLRSLKRGTVTSKEDAKELAILCTRFEELLTNLSILTICETKETAIKNLFMLFTTSKAVIVPRDSCVLKTRDERVHEENEGDHLDICNVTPISALSGENFIQKALSSALSRLKIYLASGSDSPQTALSTSAIADHDASLSRPQHLLRLATDSSGNQATYATNSASDSRRADLSDFSTSIPNRDVRLPYQFNLSERDPDFYGRNDILKKLRDCLLPATDQSDEDRVSCLRTFGICGPGGMGKTQVANEFANESIDMFDAIFWISAEEKTKLGDEFSRIAVGLGLVLDQSSDALDPTVTRELVKGWLAKPVRSYSKSDNSDDYASWLLIFDNVDDPDTISDFWPPVISNGSILITSRDSLAKTRFYQIENGIDLPPLSNQDASQLLLRLTWREENPEDKKLSLSAAEQLGCMPLALKQMAGVMVRQDLSFADFLSRYEEQETHDSLFNMSLQPSHKRNDYKHTLASVWALEKLEHSAGLLDVMAFLDPDGIPEEFLKEAVKIAQLADYPKSISAYQDARSELLKSSLIKNDRAAQTLSIHRLIQDGARARMDPQRATAVFATATELLRSVWPAAALGIRHGISRWKKCATVSPHILRLKEHFVRAGKGTQSLWASNFSFATLLNELGWYFQERGYTPEAIKCYHVAQKNIYHILGEVHAAPSTTQTHELKNQATALLAETHNNIAGSATEYNQPDEALEHFLVYNKMLVEEHGADKTATVTDPRLTSSFFNVAMSYMMNSNYEEAIEWLNNALMEAERLPNPVQVKRARSLALINLGLDYWLMGRQEEASQTLERALREREEILGPNDRESMITGRIWHSLGNVRRSQGLLDESLDCHERALQHFKETVGNTHHRTGNSCFKVAEHYIRIGNFGLAVKLLDQAIKIFDRHPCYAGEKGRAAFLKSVAMKRMGGEGEDSEACLKLAHEVYEKLRNDQRAAAYGKGNDKMLRVEDFNRYVHVWGR